MVVLMVVGYSGYYLCRSSFSVAKPLLLEAFPSFDKAKLGILASVGTLMYAIGKFIHGPLADKLGGRPMFIYGMLGAIAFSLMFAFGGPPIFLLAWSCNRFVQSAGWGGMVRIVSQWSRPNQYGSIMAVISLSYLVGDFLSRLLLGYWVGNGATWQQLFQWSAIGLTIIAIPVTIFLKEKPIQEAFPDQKEQILNSFAAQHRQRFWLVCFLSFCFTLMRETFNEWTPTYLTEAAGLTKASAGQASSVFPLLGAFSVLAVGIYSDRIAKSQNPIRRLMIVPIGLGLSALLLLVLGQVSGLPAAVTVALVGLVGFCLIGPYSLFAGATSLDFGGRMSAAKSAGFIDGIGYLGGIASGYLLGSLAQSQGWALSMSLLGIFCAVVAVIAVLLFSYENKKII